MAKAAWIAQQTDARFVRELFPVRKRDTHKGDYGKVLLLCGSEGLTGAARLAAKARAAYRLRTRVPRRAGEDLSDRGRCSGQ